MAEENIVKRVCRELDMTQKELAEMLDVPKGTVSRWATSEAMPKMVRIALELIVENEKYKKGTEALRTAIELLNLQK